MTSDMRIWLAVILTLTGFACVDTGPLKTPDGDDLGAAFIAASAGDADYTRGIADALSAKEGIFLKHRSSANPVGAAASLFTGSRYLKDAYLAILPEDIFFYARDRYKSQFDSDPSNADKTYLRIASRVRVLVSLYTKKIYLLVNTNNVSDNDSDSEITFNDLLKSATAHKINLGINETAGYITAKTVTSAHSFTTAPQYLNLAESEALAQVIAGSADAAFFIGREDLLSTVSASSPVRLVRVYMPDHKKNYDEDISIFSGAFAFHDHNINSSAGVRTLLTAGPVFSQKNTHLLLNYFYENASEYKNFDSRYEELSASESFKYMKQNPKKHSAGHCLIFLARKK